MSTKTAATSELLGLVGDARNYVGRSITVSGESNSFPTYSGTITGIRRHNNNVPAIAIEVSTKEPCIQVEHIDGKITMRRLPQGGRVLLNAHEPYGSYATVRTDGSVKIVACEGEARLFAAIPAD